jgi:23S rRNA (cytidine1920-2'-O)/16S rRNA (cytidine1409-2'-O)-methyltransferase
MGDKRLDVLINERGMTRSRSKAKARIMAGEVYVEGEQIDKAGTYIDEDADIDLRGDDNPYVSRGGLKLASAMEVFEDLSFEDSFVLDVGASTGGFTDYALQHGAEHVYALDVGYGQLDYHLREDDRVTVIERTNIRETEAGLIDRPADIATIDCSFISLELVLPNTLPHLTDDADLVVLVKPQFEAGKENVGKGGVVRDETIRQQTIDEVIDTAESLGLETVASTDSEVHGPSGNIEHFVWWRRT